MNVSSKLARTTVVLPEDLLFEIKKKALMERKSLRQVVVEGLNFYLKQETRVSEEGEKRTKKYKIDELFGVLGKGEKGIFTVKKLREKKTEEKRENYLKKLWRKS